MIEILATKGFASGMAPAKPDLDAWIETYALTIPTVMDPPGTGTPTSDALSPRETSYIIELKTMKIVKRIPGDIFGGTTVAIMDDNIAQIIALLKK